MTCNIANPLDVLESTLRNMKLEVMNMLHDPFDQGRIATYIENALATIADMKAPPIAHAPSKHEPEPIAPPFGRSKPPARAGKRA